MAGDAGPQQGGDVPVFDGDEADHGEDPAEAHQLDEHGGTAEPAGDPAPQDAGGDADHPHDRQHRAGQFDGIVDRLDGEQRRVGVDALGADGVEERADGQQPHGRRQPA